ncbi:MAG TPA: GDYXXLXY domain-containing protein [Alphaproteobacteria bacterium]
MTRLRNAVVLAGLLCALTAAGLTIQAKERILAEGRTVLLELAPVDPRSLIQGDYMALRYAPKVLPAAPAETELPAAGAAVLGIDGTGVAVYRRLDRGDPLAADEVRLRYRSLLPYGDVRYGAESYFFEEGLAEAYQLARYGVLKVDEAGRSVLVGLADAEGRLIQPR